MCILISIAQIDDISATYRNMSDLDSFFLLRCEILTGNEIKGRTAKEMLMPRVVQSYENSTTILVRLQ